MNLFRLSHEFVFLLSLLNSGFVATLNCTSPTSESLIDALEKELFTKKLYRPVKSFSDPLTISVDMTVVGILGVVSHWATQTSLSQLSILYFLWILFIFNNRKYVSSLEWKGTNLENIHMASPGKFSEHWHKLIQNHF